MNTRNKIGFLFTACVAGSITACGGGNSGPNFPSVPFASVPAPAPTPTPSPGPVPPPPPAAPTSNAPYWLAGEAGTAATGTLRFADTTVTLYTTALVLVDPANPAAPVQVAAPGTWLELGSVVDTATPDAYRRILVYAKDDRLWKLDLAKSGAVPVPTQLAVAPLSGAGGICSGGVRLFPARPATASVAVLRSPGPDGACSTADDVHRLVRLDGSFANPPAVINGEPIDAVYTDAGAIDGWIVRRGTQVVRESAGFDAAAPVVLISVGANSAVTPVGVAGVQRPGVLVLTIQPESSSVHELWTLDLASGSSRNLGLAVEEPYFLRHGASDANHYYFIVWGRDRNEIRRFDYRSPSAISADDFVIRESRGNGYVISKLRLTGERVAYEAWDLADFGFLKTLPKSAHGVVGGDPATGPQPTVHVAWTVDEWTTIGSSLWFTASDGTGAPKATSVSADGQTTATRSGAIAGYLLDYSPGPLAPAVAGVLMTDPAFGGIGVPSTLRLHRASDGAATATYASLPPSPSLIYGTVRATLQGTDAPALVTVTGVQLQGSSAPQKVDLYFINGTQPGLTRLTTNVP